MNKISAVKRKLSNKQAPIRSVIFFRGIKKINKDWIFQTAKAKGYRQPSEFLDSFFDDFRKASISKKKVAKKK